MRHLYSSLIVSGNGSVLMCSQATAIIVGLEVGGGKGEL